MRVRMQKCYKRQVDIRMDMLATRILPIRILRFLQIQSSGTARNGTHRIIRNPEILSPALGVIQPSRTSDRRGLETMKLKATQG